MSRSEVEPTPNDDISAIKQLFVRGYTSAIQGFLIIKALHEKFIYNMKIKRVIYLSAGSDQNVEEIELIFWSGRPKIDWNDAGEEINTLLKDIAEVEFLGFGGLGTEKSIVYRVSINRDWRF